MDPSMKQWLFVSCWSVVWHATCANWWGNRSVSSSLLSPSVDRRSDSTMSVCISPPLWKWSRALFGSFSFLRHSHRIPSSCFFSFDADVMVISEWVSLAFAPVDLRALIGVCLAGASAFLFPGCVRIISRRSSSEMSLIRSFAALSVFDLPASRPATR